MGRAHALAVVLALALHIVQPNVGSGVADWLGGVTLSASELPGYLPLSSSAMPVTEIVQGQGPYYDQLRAGSLVSGFQRSFGRFGGGVELRIQLVEFLNSHYAAAAPKPAGEIPAIGFVDRHTMVAQQFTADHQLNSFAVFNKGRVQVQMLVVSDAAAVSAKAAAALLVGFANQQYAKMPMSADLGTATTISLRGPQLQLYSSIFILILMIELIVWLAASLVDRTFRDAVLRRLLRSDRQSDARVVVHDVRSDVRSRRRRYRWGVVARMVAVLVLFTVAYFKVASIVESIMFLAGCGFVLAAIQAVLDRHRNHGKQFWSPGSVAFAVVGGMFSLALAGGGALLLFIQVVVATNVPGAVTVTQVHAFSTLDLSLAVLLFSLADLPYRLARRISAKWTRSVLRQDRRPEILLLRAFIDDGVRLRAHRTNRQPLLQRLTLRRRESFEEILAWSLWKFGPPVTLGEPGTKLPRLGAVRPYFGDDEWRGAVKDLIRRSSIVVLVVGRSPSLVDEIGIIRDGGWLAKCVFVLPPVPNRELRARMAVLTNALHIDPGCVPSQDLSHPAVLAMSFDSRGTLELSVAGTRDDITYQAVVEQICQAKLAGEISRVSDPEPVLRRPGESITQLLRTSPTRRAVRRAKMRRVLRVSPWLITTAGSTLTSLLLAASGTSGPTATAPGQVLAQQPLYSIVATSAGRIVGIDGTGSLLEELDGTTVRPAVRLPTMRANKLQAGQGMVYATSVSAPYRLVAVDSDHPYHVAWVQKLPAASGEVVEAAGRVFVALPNQSEIAVFDKNSGQPGKLIQVDQGPLELALAAGMVVVSQVNGDSLELIDPARLVETQRISVGFSPARLTAVGGTLFVSSLEGSKIAEYSLPTWRLDRTVALPKFAAVFAVGDNEILAGTYDDQPRLDYIDRRTLKVTKSVPVPSQVYTILFLNGRFYCDYPDSGLVTVVLP